MIMLKPAADPPVSALRRLAAAIKPADPRVSALRRFAVSITALTILGQFWLGFEQSWAQQLVAVGTSLGFTILFEAVHAWSHGRRPGFVGRSAGVVTFFLPAYISGMAIGLLLYPGNRFMPFIFATAVAVGGKYVLRAPVNGRMRHVMNPSNLGIAATLVLFSWVGVGLPYMFTENVHGALDWIIPAVLLLSGLVINSTLTRRWPLVFAWLGAFAAQAVIRGALTDVAIVAALAPMTGVAFLLFTNYMITDPGSTPSRPRNQVVFAVVAAACYAIITAAHLVYGLFLCIVITCALRAVLLWAIHLRALRRSPRTAAAFDVAPAPRPQTAA
jgi:hypothetical protein